MISLRYSIKDLEARTALKEVAERMSRPEQALKECGLVLLRSVAKNFKAGGRPVRWKKSKRAKREHGQTLVDTARLKKSITMQVSGKKLIVGTNVKYAAMHHFGGKINKNVTVKKFWRYMDKAFGKRIPARKVLVRSHQRHMKFEVPERPFLMVQDEDWRVFRRIIGDYVTG